MKTERRPEHSFVKAAATLCASLLLACAALVSAQAQLIQGITSVARAHAGTGSAKATIRTASPAPAGASISGTVRFAGAPPKLERAKSNMDACGTSLSYDRLVLGKNGGVEYSLVYIANPPAGRANFPALTVSQNGCRYSPHLSIINRGSNVTFLNGDEVLHNVHGYAYTGSDRSTSFNFGQPTKGQQTPQQFRKAGMASVECDVHPWMNAWIWVTDNPYCAVTKADGSYSIDGLPPGTYTVVMWHEGWKLNGQPNGRPAFSGPIVKQQQVTVGASGTITQDFELQ